MRPHGTLCLAVFVILLTAAPATAQAPTSEQVEFFENDIRPLLADNCLQCHNSRLAAPFGGLRLDTREGLLEGGDSGPAVVPGQPDDSRLIQLVQGRPLLMPPTGPLDDEQVGALVEWVAMGAPWGDVVARSDAPDPSAPFDLDERRRRHWAWQPIRRPQPPTVNDLDWSNHPVDRFIQAELESNNLTPARSADRHALIRRLSFDLRGLPPTPGEIAAFVTNPAPDAYERLVDRYLSSPRFGERWARHWMDLFRYAESHGSEGDPDTPLAWRYRDYLIRAFNGDVGYDQLIREHLAGDLLPRPRLNPDDRLNESIIGTGHFRMVEHGFQPVDPWEDRVKWTDNQIDVVSKAFSGLTVSCARCHDHKFDAISQADYYSLFGTLYGARPTQRAIDTPGTLATNRDELVELKTGIKSALADIWVDSSATLDTTSFEEAAEADPDESLPPARAGSAVDAWLELSSGTDADVETAWQALQDHWRTEIADREEFNRNNFEPGWDLTGPDHAKMVGHGTGFSDRPSDPGEFAVSSVRNRVLDGIYPGGVYTHLLSSKHNGVIQSPRFTIDNDYLSFRVLGSDLSFAQLIIENYAVPRGGIHHLRYSPKKDEMTWATWDTTFWKGFTAYVEFATRDDATHFTYDPADSRQRPRPSRRQDGRSAIGASHVVFHDREEAPKETVLPVLYLLDDTVGDEPAGPPSVADLDRRVRRRLSAAVEAWRDDTLTEQQAAFLDDFIRRDVLPRTLDELPTVRPLVVDYRTLEAEVPVPRRAPGVIEEGSPDQPILVRGSHKNPGAVVPRAFLSAVDGRPYDEARFVRLRLADAITARDNPLTARVAVNRIWRHLFGRGIVRTVDNFGRLGDPPSHPELLDYLAQQFTDDGYSVKRLVKTLVTTQVYRLSSQGSAGASEADPSNRLLQHAPLRRLDAEAIRDAVLATSGRLDLEMYGPSVSVYYPRGKGKTQNSQTLGPIDGDGRRSIYQEIRRNVHNPFLEVFDLPKPATTRGQRDATNVPAQSLTMLNSPFVIGQAAVWGQRLAEGEAYSVEGRIDHMFLKAVGRPPTVDERARAATYVSARAGEQGTSGDLILFDEDVWQDLAHSLFNLKEFIFLP